MNRHERYLNILHKVAETMNPVNGFRLCAMIVYNNDIISIGQCRRKTHPLQKKYGRNVDSIDLHAEIDAIVKALRTISIDELSKATLYVLRLRKVSTKDHTLIRSLARPCSGCSKAIAAFNIRKVFYTVNENEYEERVY